MSLVLLVANGSLIAGTFAASRWLGGHGIGPLELLGWQVSFASVVVLGIALACGQAPRWSAANVRYAAIAGSLGIAAPSLVTFTALQRLPTGLVGALAGLSPVFTCLLAHLFGLQRVQPRQWVGVVTGAVAVFVLLLPGTALPRTADLPWALLAMLAPLSLAAGNLYRTRAWPQGLSPLAAASQLSAIQAVVLLSAGLCVGSVRLPGWPLAKVDVALLAAGAAAAWVQGTTFVLQRRAGPVAVGQLGNVITVAGLGFGVCVFGESYSPGGLCAIAVVAASVALVVSAPTSNTANSSVPLAPRVDAR